MQTLFKTFLCKQANNFLIAEANNQEFSNNKSESNIGRCYCSGSLQHNPPYTISQWCSSVMVCVYAYPV